jgi:hypothetical protein
MGSVLPRKIRKIGGLDGTDTLSDTVSTASDCYSRLESARKMITAFQPRKSLLIKLFLVVLSGAGMIAAITSWRHQGAKPNGQSGSSHPRFDEEGVTDGRKE